MWKRPLFPRAEKDINVISGIHGKDRVVQVVDTMQCGGNDACKEGDHRRAW
jgi:hypothetical protein